MKLVELKALLERIEQTSGRRADELEVVVTVNAPYAVGGTPAVGVRSVHRGIDWDSSRVLITLDAPVTRLSEDDVKAIHESVKAGQSWHAYQEYKRLRARIDALEAELAKPNKKGR